MPNRSVEAILADVATAQAALAEAPEIAVSPQCEQHRGHAGYVLCALCGEVEWVRDMRRPEPIPELPEAATRLGVGYVSGPLIGPDGRRKYTVSGTPEQVQAW